MPCYLYMYYYHLILCCTVVTNTSHLFPNSLSNLKSHSLNTQPHKKKDEELLTRHMYFESRLNFWVCNRKTWFYYGFQADEFKNEVRPVKLLKNLKHNLKMKRLSTYNALFCIRKTFVAASFFLNVFFWGKSLFSVQQQSAIIFSSHLRWYRCSIT